MPSHTAPHPGLVQTASWGDRYLVWLGWVLLGYALLGRGFAYIGVPPLFIGEATALFGVLALLSARGAATTALKLPLVQVLLVFMAWGAACTLPYLPAYGIDALRDGVLWGYGVFAVVVAGLLVHRPARLRNLFFRYRGFVVAVAALAWLVLLLKGYVPVLPKVPGTKISIVEPKSADVLVHAACAGAFVVLGMRRANPVLVVMLAVPFVLGNRAGMLGSLVAVGLAILLSPLKGRVAWLGYLGVCTVLALVLLSPTVMVGSREISTDLIWTKVESIFTESEAGRWDNTKDWRLEWWEKIVGYTVDGPYFWTGKGYGVNLSVDDGFKSGAGEDLRSPHNGHMTVLARSGVPGLRTVAGPPPRLARGDADPLLPSSARTGPDVDGRVRLHHRLLGGLHDDWLVRGHAREPDGRDLDVDRVRGGARRDAHPHPRSLGPRRGPSPVRSDGPVRAGAEGLRLTSGTLLMSQSKWAWTPKRRVLFHVRRAIRHRPAIYLPLSRMRRRPYMLLDGVPMAHTGVFDEDTDVVIEGLYRCGNTFAVVAFQSAQERPVRAAHHLHAEAQVIAGVRAGVPTVLLIRDPEAVAVSSEVSFGVPLEQALRDYVAFYSRVLPYRDRVVVADFREVTGDFGRVIEAVNEKFGTRFVPFDHTEENVERCFGIIDEFYRRTASEPRRTVARPSEQRGSQKDEVRARYHSPRYVELRRQAEDLYRTLTARAPSRSAALAPPAAP